MSDVFDADEPRAAEALDAEIERLLTVGPSPAGDPALTWLAAAIRTDAPPTLASRVRTAQARVADERARPVRIALAALAALFLAHGFGALTVSEWVAREVGDHHSPHAATEGGLALLAVGAVMVAGLVRRRWLPVSVTVGTALGLAYGVIGVGEVDEFAAGSALHLSQGAVAGFLAITWWRMRRYGSSAALEGGA